MGFKISTLIREPNAIFYVDPDGARVAKFGVLNAEDVYPEPFNTPTETFNWQGTVAAYEINGPPQSTSAISKFPFAISSGSATDTGGDSLSPVGKDWYSTASNQGFGFAAGGATYSPDNINGVFAYPSSIPTHLNNLEKFPFSISSGTATDTGEIAQSKTTNATGGQSDTSGYIIGGANPPGTAQSVDSLHKYPFGISSGGSSDIGEMLAAIIGATSHGSLTEVFVGSGNTRTAPSIDGSVPVSLNISKFPHSITSGSATDVGELNFSHVFGASGSDTLSSVGLLYGGRTVSPTPTLPIVEVIEKFPFSISSGTASDVGETLPGSIRNVAGWSSTTDAFTGNGGTSPPYSSTFSDKITKYPFSITSGSSTDVGEMLVAAMVHHPYGIRD